MVAIALLPSDASPSLLNSMALLSATPFVITPPTEDIRWVTHVCAQLAKTAEPLILVFEGPSCTHAPAVGFSRRALRRPAIHYVLVNPTDLPNPSSEYSDWPDAPITIVINSDDASAYSTVKWQASLRGWIAIETPLVDFLNNI